MRVMTLLGAVCLILVAGEVAGVGLLIAGFSHGWDEGWIRFQEGGEPFGWVLIAGGVGLAAGAGAMLGRDWRTRAPGVAVMMAGATLLGAMVSYLLDRPERGSIVGIAAGAVVLLVGVAITAAGLRAPASK